MKIKEDVRKYAAEQGIAEEEALKKGMEAKSKEFVEKGVEVYAKGVNPTLSQISEAPSAFPKKHYENKQTVRRGGLTKCPEVFPDNVARSRLGSNQLRFSAEQGR